MTEIVLRVGLVGGDHLDVVCEEASARWPRAARSCNGLRDPVTDPAAGGFGRIARRERGGSR
jgi:hypothetical protein